MPQIICPLCESTLTLPKNARLNSTFFCARCDCLLQVVGLEPSEVDFPFKASATSDEPKLGRRLKRPGPTK